MLIGFVGNRKHRAFQRARNRVFGRFGLVLIVDCVGHSCSGETLRFRIQTADDSLQLGKFFDQFGGQIGFGKLRSLLHCIDVKFNLFARTFPESQPSLSQLAAMRSDLSK